MIEARERPAVRPSRRGDRLRRLLPAIQACTDAGLIYGAFVLAYWVRYTLQIGPRIQSYVDFGAYQPLGALLLLTMLSVLVFKGAYRVRMSMDVVDDLGTIVSASTITVGLIVVVTTLVQRGTYSRGVIVYLWLFLIVLLGLGRMLSRGIQGYCHRQGWGTRRAIVVGATDAGKMAMQGMMNRPDLGYELVGFVDHRTIPTLRDFGRFRALGALSDIPPLIEAGQVDEVVIALPASAHEEVWPILRLCEEHGVGLKIIPDLFEMNLSRVEVDDIAGIPLLDVRERPSRWLARVLKRLTDILVAAVGLVITAPFVLILMALIRLESKGSPVLRQVRVGTGEHCFTCFKLRTMEDGAEERRLDLQHLNDSTGPLFKMKDDPRRTRVGRFLRAWSLDELPQLVNVLRGEMSVVGPRPALPEEVEQYEPWHRRRLEVKPGLTGIWQVSGRSDLPFDEMILMDVYYVDNWSPALDVRILLRTVRAVLRRDGAY
jgi:exopolysaccharide biosynthesis polyprenyl glycosylphosphotransferase